MTDWLTSEDERDPMSRALDDEFAADGNAAHEAHRVGTSPVASPHVPDPGGIAERHVCPFCGSLNESTAGPCPKCTMENTPATRKATKVRIGPWYVLQQRNPAAPGMRWETLLNFVHKGRVKPRSVVRGPSTHQLWRFAMHVKGVSREFGLCYHCGGMLDRTAHACPRCNRPQDPPADPDALLESADDDAATPGEVIYRDLPGTSVGPRHEADIVVPALGDVPATPSEPITARPAAISTPTPSASLGAESPASSVPTESPAARPKPATAAAPPPGRSAAPQEQAASSAWHVNDLAAALGGGDEVGGLAPAGPPARFGGGGFGGSGGDGGGRGGGGGPEFPIGPLGGNRGIDVPAVLVSDLQPFYPQGRGLGRPVLAIVALVAIGAGVWLYLDDGARRRAVGWFEDAYAALRRTGGDNTVAKQRGNESESRQGAGGKQYRSKPDPARPTDVVVAPQTSQEADTVTPPGTQQLAGDPATHPAGTPGETIAANTAVPPTEFPFTVPDGQPETAVPTPAPAGQSPPAATQPDIDALRLQAKRVYAKALDAQRERNYPEAVRLYEQVRSDFPRDAWPLDLELRLKIMRDQIR